MLLVVLVILGVAVFCFWHGYVLAGVVCLGGFSNSFGWPCLAFVSGVLLWQGHWLVASLPPLLIAWNVFGLRFFNKAAFDEMLRNARAGR
jgi:hypothetical protein